MTVRDRTRLIDPPGRRGPAACRGGRGTAAVRDFL